MRVFFVLTVMALIAAPAMANMELLTNGDFETGNYSGWTWAADAGSEPTMVATVATFNSSNAFRVNPGNNSGGGGGERGGKLSQSISLTAGQTYDISGELLAIQNISGTNVDGGTITVSLAGNTLHVFDVGYINSNTTLTDNFATQFTSTYTGSTVFELYFTRGWRNYSPVMYHYADNLSVSLVPAPGAAVLGMIGLGIVGWVKRRFA